MKLKQFIKKNLVLIIVLLLVFIFSIAYFKNKEGFGKPTCRCPSGSFLWNNECYSNCSSRIAGSTQSDNKCVIDPRYDKHINQSRCTSIYNGVYQNKTCYFCPTDTTTTNSSRPRPSNSSPNVYDCIYNAIPTTNPIQM